MLEQDGLCCVMAQAPRMARGNVDVKALVGSLAQRCDCDSAEMRNPSKRVSHVNFLQWAAEQVCGVLAEHGVCEAGRADKTVDFLQSGKHELRECMAQKAPECESFRYALFHCKRGQMDARTRIQGNKDQRQTSLLEVLAPVRALQPEEILGTAGSPQPWRTVYAKRSVLDKFEHARQ
ncbi:hypothetical protein QJQ45_020148, partial [Haematococcus lacustris]